MPQSPRLNLAFYPPIRTGPDLYCRKLSIEIVARASREPLTASFLSQTQRFCTENIPVVPNRGEIKMNKEKKHRPMPKFLT